MNMYKRTYSTASGSFASFTDYSDDEGPAEIGSIDSSTLNNGGGGIGNIALDLDCYLAFYI